MKLTRFYHQGLIRPGLFVDDETILDLGGFCEDWNEQFFGSDGISRLRSWISALEETAQRVQVEGVRLAPAIAGPSKIICIGLNYADHAKETGVTPPAEPVIFFKSTTAFCGPYDDLVIPRGSQKTDWEVELAVVIGKLSRHVSQSRAMDYVAGFSVHDDYSERAWHLEGTGPWVKGKSADTFAPFGPFLATPDELEDVDDLRLWLKLNGELKQDGNTRNLLFSVPYLISYVSRFMTLLPGDVISTGTPAGVGHGLKPPQYRAGDVVELGIDGLGSQRQRALTYSGELADDFDSFKPDA